MQYIPSECRSSLPLSITTSDRTYPFAVNAAGKKYQPSAVLIRLRRLTSLLWVFVHAPELLENVYIMVYRTDKVNKIVRLAEREGFEPPIPVKVCPLSRRIVSTAHAPLRVKLV